MPRAVLVFLAIIVLKLLNIIPLAAGGEVEMRRVRAELPAAARRLDEMFAQVRGTARLSHEDPHARAKLPLTEARFAIDHGMEKVELARFTRDTKPIKLADMVYCVRDGTAFRLYRRAGESIYAVRGIGATPSEQNIYVSLFGRFVLAHHGALGRPLSRLLESPDFEIISAEPFDQAGKHLMKVDCAFGPRPPKGQVSFVLDPENGWIVRSYRHRPSSDPDSLFQLEVEYGPSRDGIPLPRRVRLDEPGGVVDHCEFTEWSFAPTPLSEFNMTYYGLPDLVKARRPRNSLAVWLAGLAVLVGAIAFVLWRFASRGTHSARA